MNVEEILNRRYSTKEFDHNKKISTEDFIKIMSMLRLSPSSTNIQPWHFVIASTDEGKKRVAKASEGFFEFNKPKVLDASHVVVFCSRVDADEEYLLHVLDKEDEDGRFPQAEFKDMTHGGRSTFKNIHEYDLKDLPHWLGKQVYLNMGYMLHGAGMLGIDTLTMEGLDMKVLDEEFGLREKGFTAVAAISLGYHLESDFNAHLKKSRLSEEEIFTILD